MLEYVLFAGQLGQIILQVASAGLAFIVYKRINHGNRWFLLSGGFALMAIRRVTALLTFDPSSTIEFVQLADKLLLPLTISILLFEGMVWLNNATKREVSRRESIEKNLGELKRITERLTQ